VACQLDTLQKCAKLSELTTALNSLPKTLDATYERILLGIDELWQDDVHKILQWLCVAKQPMRLDEIVDALSVNFSDGLNFDPSDRYIDPQDILMRCSSLVTINWYGVQLAHFSVKEYLVASRIQNSVAHTYAVNIPDAIELVAKTCLASLLQFQTIDYLDYQVVSSYSLAFYAAQHWVDHVRDRGDAISDDLQALTLKLFEPSQSQRVSYNIIPRCYCVFKT
jgi:hypothetical protein